MKKIAIQANFAHGIRKKMLYSLILIKKKTPAPPPSNSYHSLVIEYPISLHHICVHGFDSEIKIFVLTPHRRIIASVSTMFTTLETSLSHNLSLSPTRALLKEIFSGLDMYQFLYLTGDSSIRIYILISHVHAIYQIYAIKGKKMHTHVLSLIL